MGKELCVAINKFTPTLVSNDMHNFCNAREANKRDIKASDDCPRHHVNIADGSIALISLEKESIETIYSELPTAAPGFMAQSAGCWVFLIQKCLHY